MAKKRKNITRSLPHYVYVMGWKPESFTEDEPVKIGLTTDPRGRRNTLQVGCPYKILVRSVFRCKSREAAIDLELRLHSNFSKSRLMGEWFCVPSIDVASTVLDDYADYISGSKLAWKDSQHGGCIYD